MKKYLFAIEDEKVKKLIYAYGNALKYLCEYGERKSGKNDPKFQVFGTFYVNEYFRAYNALLDEVFKGKEALLESPAELICLMMQPDIDKRRQQTDDATLELLSVVSRYLNATTGKEVDVVCYPFYGINSHNAYTDATGKYGSYFRELLIKGLGNTRGDLDCIMLSSSQK